MRILFTTTRGTGNFGPLMPFARACVRAGHEVLVAAAPPVASLADGAELPFRALPEPPEDELAAAWEQVFSLPPEQWDDYVIREIFAACHARAALPGTLATIEEWGPDVVVRDSCEFSAAVAAERLGVPHAAIGVFLWTRNDDWAAEVAAPVLDELRAGVGLGPRGLGSSARAAADTGAALARRSDITDRGRGPALPRAAKRRGRPASGLVGRVRGPSRVPLVRHRGAHVGLLPRACTLKRSTPLPGLPARILVTIGNSRDPAELGSLPPSVHVEQWVPQGSLMHHAAAMVGHGGSGSTLTALNWGVPLALVPLFADQGTNAGRVAEAGRASRWRAGPRGCQA